MDTYYINDLVYICRHLDCAAMILSGAYMSNREDTIAGRCFYSSAIVCLLHSLYYSKIPKFDLHELIYIIIKIF